MSRIGRPPLGQKTRNVRLQAMFTYEEAVSLERLADERGVSLSTLIHTAMLARLDEYCAEIAA